MPKVNDYYYVPKEWIVEQYPVIDEEPEEIEESGYRCGICGKKFKHFEAGILHTEDKHAKKIQKHAREAYRELKQWN